jgi:hypothetical protein
MRLNSLLMCRDQQPLKLIGAALDQLEIEQEICWGAPDALELLGRGYYSALVLDFDLPGAAQVARMARCASARRRPVVFAMISALTDVGATYQAGANFVLYKPLVYSQVLRSLRAASGFMQPDRRRSPRQKLETIVYLQYGIAALPALMIDLNERGMSLQAPEHLPAVPEVPLRFVLPGTNNMVEAKGEIIWADENGRAGMLFSGLSAHSRKFLRAWLHRQSSKRRSRTPSQAERPRSVGRSIQ